MTRNDLTAALELCRPGDVITITTDDGKSRTVTVESASARYVFTTSGAVRPGRIRGGSVNLGSLTYSPTLAQQARPVVAVTRHAALSLCSR